ncbi:unnamed protein product [Paramecium pentaurelia]|uniref:Uncharacterized protein n=1 Tax=Paramecium pentaurelia TaxID=43138 RepID=A0A8S1V8M5_9CILI|nr:unnamed protein product [Paramecium pentaurelia]
MVTLRCFYDVLDKLQFRINYVVMRNFSPDLSLRKKQELKKFKQTPEIIGKMKQRINSTDLLEMCKGSNIDQSNHTEDCRKPFCLFKKENNTGKKKTKEPVMENLKAFSQPPFIWSQCYRDQKYKVIYSSHVQGLHKSDPLITFKQILIQEQQLEIVQQSGPNQNDSEMIEETPQGNIVQGKRLTSLTLIFNKYNHRIIKTLLLIFNKEIQQKNLN